MVTQNILFVKGLVMLIGDYFYTLGDAAKVLGVTRICIWKWIQAGKMAGEKVGRETIFPKWEIELLKERRSKK